MMTLDETLGTVAERVAMAPPTEAEAAAAWSRVQLARHPQRPRTLDLVTRMFSEFTELAGDRLSATTRRWSAARRCSTAGR